MKLGFVSRHLSLSVLLLLGSTLAQAKPPYKVYGYYLAGNPAPLTQGPVNFANFAWNDMTHVMDAFGLPNGTEGLNMGGVSGASLIAAAHTGQTRCNLSIGGAGANTANFENDAATAANRAKFVAAITNTVQTNGYDGVDIDWEFPTNSATFNPFMQALYTAIKAMPNAYDGLPRDLTFFVSAGGSLCGVDWATIGGYCDAGIMSGYDYYVDQYNGPLSDPGSTYGDCQGWSANGDIEGTYAKLTTSGMVPGKLALGCPLYGTPNEVPFIMIQSYMSGYVFHSPQEEFSADFTGPDYTDGTVYGDDYSSFCAKITWALATGLQGIGLWEISYAYPPTAALNAPVWAAIGGTAACLSLASPTPSATRTATRTATPTGTPSRTPTPSATASPTASRSASPSVSPTPSGTLTSGPTGTASATASATGTAGPASTSSATATASPATTPSSTATASPAKTATVTPTVSVSSTPSATRTDSPSATASATAMGTATTSPSASPSPTSSPAYSPSPSPSCSGTWSPSPSATGSGSPSATATGTPALSPTPSATVSPADSPSASASVSPSATGSPSPSATPSTGTTLTPSPAVTPSSTQTPIPSITASASASATLSPSVGASPAATPMATATATVTQVSAPTATATSSPTPASGTPTASPTASPTAGSSGAATRTPAPAGGIPLVLQAVPVPNPVSGPLWRVYALLSAPADGIVVEAYTVAEVKVGSWQVPAGPWNAGWNNLSFAAPPVPGGLYYLRLLASRGGTAGWKSPIVKLFYLP